MEENFKLVVLESIGKIYEKAQRCRLKADFFDEIDTELTFLSKYFRTTKLQSFFIALTFAMNYKGDTVDMKDLIEFLRCNPMKILEYTDDFNFLLSSGIFVKQQSNHRVNVTGANDQFSINEKVSEAILNNKPFPKIENEEIQNIFGLLEKIYNIGVLRDQGKICTSELFDQTKELISCNLHFPLVEKIIGFKFDIEDAYVYIYLIWKTVSGRETTDLNVALKGIYDDLTRRLDYMQKFLSGENILIKDNYIELVEADLFNDVEMKLSDTSKDLIRNCGINLTINKKKKENIFSPTDIPKRELIFNESEMKQLYLLKDLLKDKKFNETQKRLNEKNLPNGITALLHGEPGTGKTELVKQIAKDTEREIMKVEISKSKSMWFGESEKIVKKIFTEYKSFCRECDRVPILLFNEADAIFSRRRDLGNSNTIKTENAIQNIILEELENFEGILVATTNLASTLDAAFERRFLFKIQFKKPSISIRAKIWQSKIPELSEDDCNFLARSFDFSGGQIDNVLRKNEIHEIIHNEKVTIENLMYFCSEETLESKKEVIGFNKN
jgi:AAA+ superfamily predicted ATPase